MYFEWDIREGQLSILELRHGVSFEEATSAFTDLVVDHYLRLRPLGRRGVGTSFWEATRSGKLVVVVPHGAR